MCSARILLCFVRWALCAALLLPLSGCPRLSQGVAYTRNVVYGEGYVARTPGEGHELRTLKLDIIALEEPAASPRPAVILVHGGGFEGGSRRNVELVDLADSLALAGYACFLIEYRLMGDDPPAPPPYDADAQQRAGHAAVVDTKAAMRHVRANAAAYGIDQNRIALLGESAGAIAVFGAGLSNPGDFTSDGPAYPIPTGNLAGTDYKPRALVDLWGMARPFAAEFDAGDPPIFIAHGVLDTRILVTEALFIAEQCDAHGIPHELRLFLFEGHGAWGGRADGKTITELVIAFLDTWL